MSLPDALVVLFDRKRAYHGYTDSSGKIIFSNVIAGTYSVIVVKDGYKHYVGSIIVDTDKTVNITLTPIPVYKAYEDVTLDMPTINYETNVFSGQEKAFNMPTVTFEYEVG